MIKVLVLGGTAESRALAVLLVADGRFEVVTSLAGRVRDPLLPSGETRVGGFGGSDGLADWIRREAVEVLVDATHPFAAEMSANARNAASATGVPLVQLVRPAWTPGAGDTWRNASSMDHAADIVESTARRAFLTVGRQGVHSFAHNARTWFLVRSIEPPDLPMPPGHELLLSRGPFELVDETALMIDRRIDLLITKNSGGAMTEAKLVAARELHIPVVMVARPLLPAGDHVVDNAADVLSLLGSRF